MSADSSLPTAAHAPAAGTEQPQELPRAFSYEAVPARVFEYRAGVVSLLHETSPITVVFDGSALRLYAQGQSLLSLPPNAQCFQDNQTFMFPATDGVWLSVVFPDETPQATVTEFAKIIARVCLVVDGRADGDWSSRAVETIQTATAAVAGAISTTAQHATTAIGWGSVKLRDYLGPQQTHVRVSPVIRYSAAAVCTAARGTSSAVTSVVHGAAALSARLIPRPSAPKTGTGRVAAEGIRSVTTLWDKVTDAVTAVSGAALRESSRTIRHKYGDDAASVADSAAGTIAAVRDMATAVRPSTFVKKSMSHAMRAD